jgi:hypothetical protein
MKIDVDNAFAKCNFENRFYHDYLGANKMRWRVNCSYRLGDWIEEQDKEQWSIVGGRHRAIYDITDEIMSKIIMLSALSE